MAPRGGGRNQESRPGFVFGVVVDKTFAFLAAIGPVLACSMLVLHGSLASQGKNGSITPFCPSFTRKPRILPSAKLIKSENWDVFCFNDLVPTMFNRISFQTTILIGSLAALPALAAPDQIGLAHTVRNNVSQVEPKISRIIAGDDVVRDEVVQTLEDSGAKIVLKDSTNLILGPNSKLKLDKAVFSDEKSLGDIAIKLTTGSFRFVTGNSAKESYKITTPIATMGVRGTTLDFDIKQYSNMVVLKDGQASVCAGGRCVELLKVGDTAVVKVDGARIDIQLQPSSTWSFDAACNGMCGPVSFAEAQNSLTTGSIGGQGGGASGSGGGGTTGSIISGGSNSGTLPSQTAGRGGVSSSLLAPGLGSASFSQVSPF
jgi:hypothetical protein